jgi:hypothetical protein
MQVKKKIIRKRRKKRGKPYFDKNTHNAIVKYQSTEDIEEKNLIYVNEILPAFNKLAENLIFIHGFIKTINTSSYENLKSDCVSFLFETLHKFDHTRGSKAFSYFNVVAKNWLIIQSKKSSKNKKRLVSLDDQLESSANHANFLNYFSVDASQDFAILKRESMESLIQLMDTIRERLNSENEIACMDAIMSLFSRVDELDLLNKRAVFVYMRDLSSLNPKQLSVAMSSIRKHYRDLIKDDQFDIFSWR